MRKNEYNASSIQQVLKRFEAGYEMTSEDFFRAHVDDDPCIARIPGEQRQAWAMFYRTFQRLSGSGFADRVTRELELA